MMKPLLTVMCIVLVGVSAFKLVDNLGLAEGSDALKIEQAYAYATAPQQKNGAVFGEFRNQSAGDIRIVSAKADVAKRVELHTHLMDGGVMMMREVDGYDVAKDGSVTLEPSGHHIMLMGLSAPLTAGESFILQLETDAGETFETSVSVIAPGSKPE